MHIRFNPNSYAVILRSLQSYFATLEEGQEREEVARLIAAVTPLANV